MNGKPVRMVLKPTRRKLCSILDCLHRKKRSVAMDDREFHDLVDQQFVRIEDRIDELDLDTDIDTAGDLLSITLENGTSVILSRQVANREIWVAARSGGFHLGFYEGRWFCETTGEDLDTLINRVFSEQAGAGLF